MISDLASIINAEVALHPELYLTEEDQESSGAQPTKVSKEDTMIHMCTERNCKKLRLKLALDIHRYESHQILPVIGDSWPGRAVRKYDIIKSRGRARHPDDVFLPARSPLPAVRY
eukprot:scaffold13632_cov81-Skeletonema_marinoi.AAC.1